MYTLQMQRTLITLKDVAEIVGVPSAQLRLWLEAEKIKASTTYTSNQRIIGEEKVYLFSEDDIESIGQFAKKSRLSKLGF